MIHKSSKADRQRAVDALVLGFSRDPVVRWFFPEPNQYLVEFPALIESFGGRAFDHDCAYHTEGLLGSALWLPPDVHPDEDGITQVLERNVEGSKLEQAASLFEQMDQYHPDEPCWHLTFIAVDPTHTGNGHGGKLLEHTLKMIDEKKQLAYLESSNPANISLYLRHGFELIGEISAGDVPHLYPMRREPR